MDTTLPLLAWMESLSDPTRARILRLAEQQELSVGELSQVLQSPQSTTSHHLKVLSDQGWLSSRRNGRSRLYSLRREAIDHDALRLWTLLRGQVQASSSFALDQDRLDRVLRERDDQSQAYFASSASRWDKWREEHFGHRFEAEYWPALLGARWAVGDWGCGTGHTSEILARFVTRVVALDASAEMLEVARERLRSRSNVTFVKSALDRVPLDDQELDLVLMTLVLHYVGDPQRAFQEVKRVLKPGGRFVIVDMQSHEREEYTRDFAHFWQGFSEEQLRRWLAQVGFVACTYAALPVDPAAKGPALFVTVAQAPEVAYKGPSTRDGAAGRGTRLEQDSRKHGSQNLEAKQLPGLTH